MAVVSYKPARQIGRYPRWGYLDKFYINSVMPRSVFLTILIVGIGIGGWQGFEAIQRHLKGKKVVAHGPVKKRVAILTAADIGVPPSLSQQQASAVKVEVKTRPTVAMPKPVADELAVEETIASQEEISSFGGGGSTGSVFGVGDSLVIGDGDGGLPSPDDYVAFEKEPELVSIRDPDYPDLAREAGVEGTVLIRVLVGEDGFVKDQIIVQSVPMLDDAAAGAAQTAVFKPALQKDKPVAVWMVIPIEFRLHS